MPNVPSIFPHCMIDDLTRITQWSATWNLLLNDNKCTAVHFSTSQSPLLYNYSVNGKVISFNSTHKDLDILVSSDQQWSNHYQLIISKSYKMLATLRRFFSNSIGVSSKRSLYLSLVRSQLQYCSPLWHPHLLTDIKCFENVQRRATKFILKNSSFDYKDRLINLHLLPLMMEFEISDILFLVKSIKYPSNHFNSLQFINFCSHTTRSSSHLKIRHTLSRNNIQSNFYFNRIPRLWNSLPTIDLSLTLPAIKTILRDHFWNHFLSNFHPDRTCIYLPLFMSMS